MNKKTGAAPEQPKFRARPLHDNVIVKIETTGEQQRGGIIIPATVNKEPATTGVVVAIGPGREMEPGQLSAVSAAVGDRVLFLQFAVSLVKIDGEEYGVLKDTDVRAVLE